MLIHSGHFCVRLTRSFQFQAATVDISRISFWEIPNKWMDSSLCQHCISRHKTHIYVCLFELGFRLACSIHMDAYKSSISLVKDLVKCRGPYTTILGVKWHAIEIIHYPIQGTKNAGTKIGAVLYLCSTSWSQIGCRSLSTEWRAADLEPSSLLHNCCIKNIVNT